MKEFLRRAFPWLIATTISFFIVIELYILFLQTPNLSRREFFLTGIGWLLFIPVVYLILVKLLVPRLRKYSPRGRFWWLLGSLIFGLILATVTRLPGTFLLVSKHTLEIQVIKLPAEGVTIDWFTTSLGEVSLSQFEGSGEWSAKNGQLTSLGNSPAALLWRGRVGDDAKLVFVPSTSGGVVRVLWDGQASDLDLTSPNQTQIISSFTSKPNFLRYLPTYLCAVVLAGFLFLIVSLFLSEITLKNRNPVQRRRGAWLLYALPMIAVWGVYLLTFFPGLMSRDSIDQWAQVVSTHFNDAHPVFHTLLIWLITRFWFSPAAAVVFQILILSLTVAWGIGMLGQYGVPRWGAWLVAAIFALSPINGQLVITLWKDIPYSTCMLLFSLLILKIVFTKGEWLGRIAGWIALGLLGAFIALFRHNGLPISLIVLVILGIVYRVYWKSVVKSFSVFLAFYLIIQYPVYNMLNVDRNLGAKQQVFIHHIAAHMVNGGPLSSTEKRLAELIVPDGDWQYDCCSAVPTYASPGFSEGRNGENAAQIRELFINLFFKEPLVEINHQVCVTSLIWEVPSRCKSVLFFPYELSSIEKISVLPGLIPWISPILESLRDNLEANTFVSPAIYLILGLYSTLFFSLRKREARFNLFMLPAVINSLVLMVVNLSVNFRYQYGVYLVGLFSIGILILGLYTPKLSQPDEGIESQNPTAG